MPEIKERPIQFNGPMVRATLDGRKTVTRRVLKQSPADGWAFDGEYGRITSPHPRRGRFGAFIRRGVGTDFPEMDVIPCHFGMPGDRLWVRESWEDVHPLQVADGRYSQPGRAGIPGPPGVAYRTIYRADGPYPQVYHTQEHPYRALQPDPSRRHSSPAENGFTGWTPSIHMPRWASRILLEVTDVRVERLQDITYEQAVAEGIHHDHRMWFATDEGGVAHKYPQPAFRDLWISTGGDWDANPWVWAIEFKRIQP